MKHREKELYMDIAMRCSEMSYCNRKKVGCVIVKNDGIIAHGWNGTPAGEDNCCEGEDGKTKPSTIHAEDNALRKLVRSHESAVGAEVFITAAPCGRCAEKLSDARVSKVYYHEIYNNHVEGIAHLKKHNIEVEHLIKE